jgi:iron complex outermembrane recepter protein
MRSIALSLSLGLTVAPGIAAAADALEEVVVTATLRRQPLSEAPVSVTVLNERVLRDRGRQHFEDVLTAVPNLHWAGATSRPRFFLIRGIGEREQWVGSPNPSVGFLIDDIDFSGIGMAATTFDVERIEVLRGPQGLLYGANALGGLISMRGNEPGEQLDAGSEVSFGEYNSQSLGAFATGPVESLDSAWRLAVQRYRSDGYRSDAYLNRDDTMGRDEITARAKWRWQAGEETTVDLTWLHADLDNGYDGWSIDNTRRSLADRPGKDAQQADGGALRVQARAGSAGTLTLIATASQTEGEYSYDEDWGNAQSWAPYTYDYFYRALNERDARSFEVRLASDDAQEVGEVAWLVGAYVLDAAYRLDETRQGVFIDPDFPEFSGSADDHVVSHYDALNVAVFGQMDGQLTDRWGWSLGLRAEQRDADYRDTGLDSGDVRAADTSARDRMLGGQASLYFDVRPQLRLYSTVSRGYKAGGFNIGRGASLRERFDPEYLWSLDVGAKGEWLERRLYADVALFYMKRKDMQVSTGIQQDGVAGSYVFITDNASGGSNAGAEASVRWRALPQLELGGSLGLLRTRYSGYRPTGVDVSDRDQAHAPEYQLSVNATWRHAAGWMARVDFTAIDDYYFDVPPADQRAAAYSLAHVKAGYETERWSVYLWSRNVLDEDYVVRGFYFGNEPPNWDDKRYTQLGEPRQFGVTARWEFN